MNELFNIELSTAYGKKSLSVICEDITRVELPIDVLTTSAFPGGYNPTPGSLYGALAKIGISMEQLAEEPYIDLRRTSNVWLSEKIEQGTSMIRRIGCIESRYKLDSRSFYSIDEEALLSSIRAYFHLLDIASASGVKMDNVALPLLGTGQQQLSENLIITPLINECVAFLKRNESVKNMYFIEYSEKKARAFVSAIESSYALFLEASEPKKSARTPLAFISYTTPNRNVADNLCFKLESRGMRVWYAPRNVEGAYATAIAEAIEKATHFIVILSRECMLSEHVLNEIDLAFKRLPNDIKFKPLRIDTADLAPAFSYYLSRQHWMDAHIPPIEQRLEEFVDSIVGDI